MARRKLTVPRPTLVKDRRSGLWHVSYTDPATGYSRKRSTGTRDLAAAERSMPALVTAILTPAAPAGTAYGIGELVHAYAGVRAGQGKNSTYYALERLQGFFSGFSVDQLNDGAWTAYRQWRTAHRNGSAAFKNYADKFVSDATACKELNVMRGAISWARRNGWRGLENVRVHIPAAPDYVVQEFLTREEAKRLIEGCVEPHTRLFVRIALATGARMSAILELTWAQVHWPIGRKAPTDDSPAFYAVDIIEGGQHGADFSLELREALRLDLGHGRGNKRRGTGVIGLRNVELYRELRHAYDRRHSDYVIEWRGKALQTRLNLEPAYGRAGLTHYRRRQHLLKHTCCSWLVQSGQSYEAVGKLVGTSARIIEKNYGHLSPRHLATVGDVLSI